MVMGRAEKSYTAVVLQSCSSVSRRKERDLRAVVHELRQTKRTCHPSQHIILLSISGVVSYAIQSAFSLPSNSVSKHHLPPEYCFT